MATVTDNEIQTPSIAAPTKPLGVLIRPGPASLPLDQRLTQFITAHSIGMMRLSLAIVFVWFGLMKVVLPVEEFHMVIETTYWFPLSPNFVVPALGVMEILMGATVLLAGGLILRLGLLVVLLHLVATFMVLILMTDHSFENGNPLLLSHGGEYVMKNVVLIAATLAVFGSITGSAKRVTNEG